MLSRCRPWAALARALRYASVPIAPAAAKNPTGVLLAALRRGTSGSHARRHGPEQRALQRAVVGPRTVLRSPFSVLRFQFRSPIPFSDSVSASLVLAATACYCPLLPAHHCITALHHTTPLHCTTPPYRTTPLHYTTALHHRYTTTTLRTCRHRPLLMLPTCTVSSLNLQKCCQASCACVRLDRNHVILWACAKGSGRTSDNVFFIRQHACENIRQRLRHPATRA